MEKVKETTKTTSEAESVDENSSPQTVQTVQTRNKPFVELSQDADKTWHWMLWAGNGRPICLSSCGYEKKKDCIQAARAMIEACKEVKHVVVSHKK